MGLLANRERLPRSVSLDRLGHAVETGKVIPWMLYLNIAVRAVINRAIQVEVTMPVENGTADDVFTVGGGKGSIGDITSP